MTTHNPMADTRQIQSHIQESLDRLAREKTVPSWVVRSIRYRIPELASHAARPPGQRSRVLPGRTEAAGDVDARAVGERDIQLAVSAYARAIVKRSIVNGRDSTQLLMRSASWRKSLPCCSEAPIWPFCRGDC